MEDIKPTFEGPSAKEKRYDRQLRLWGAGGQEALENTSVLLVQKGPSSVGVETLKNLILPGIGHISIIDPGIVTEADLGTNFFVDESRLLEPRAKVMVEMLKELNPETTISYTVGNIEEKLEEDPHFLQPFGLILITSPASSFAIQSLGAYACENEIPLIYIQSVGFYASFTICLPPEYFVVETHPDAASAIDLRLVNPWPELSALVKEKTEGLETMSDHEHGHVPYALLLLHYLEIWKREHDGKIPNTYKEKKEFQALVESGARANSSEGGGENFEEAVKAVLKTVKPAELSRNLREIFEADECMNITRLTKGFWIIAAAVKRFYEKHGVLPLPGSLPDMKAQSADYVRLQKVYKDKARKDAAEVVQTVREIENRVNQDVVIDEKRIAIDTAYVPEGGRVKKLAVPRATTRIPDDKIIMFCKEAKFVRLFRAQPMHHAGESSGNGLFKPVCPLNPKIPSRPEDKSFIHENLTDPTSLLPLYILFLAHDLALNSPPTLSEESPLPTQETALTTSSLDIAHRLCTHYNLPQTLLATPPTTFNPATEEEEEGKTIEQRLADYAKELVRAGGGDLHTTAALVGGMVSQEAIKVLTGQYVPADDTVVWDGVVSRAWVLRRERVLNALYT